MFADMSDDRSAEGAPDPSDGTFLDHVEDREGTDPAGPGSDPDPAATADGDDAAGPDDDEAGPSSSAQRARHDRALIRRAATKAEVLRRAPKDQVRLLAAMLGVDATNTVELTVAVLTADRSALSVGRGLIDLAGMDQMELAVTASSLERADLRKLWAFASDAGADLGTVPAADAKAALAFARAVAALDKAVLDKVAAAIELARKT
jgi:hypothetical protein